MAIVYALSAFYPATSSIAFIGYVATEAEARSAAALGTQDHDQGKAIKIVRQEKDARSGDVLAFYKGGIEVSYEETVAP